MQSKKQNRVSLKDNNQGNKDIKVCSITATNTTECSINEKNTSHICKIVLKKQVVGRQFSHYAK